MSSSAVMEAQPSVVARLESLVVELSSVVARLDVDALAGREAAAAVESFARLERLAMAGKTLAAGRVAKTGYWREAGFDSPARWLAAGTKASASEAGRTLSTSQHLASETLAPTRDALVAGALTSAQAHELATASSRRPEEQRRLLALAAKETTTQLRDECRRVRLARKTPDDPKDRWEQLVGEMRFSHRQVGDDLSELSLRMPTSWLAKVLVAVNLQREAVFARARREGRRDPHQVYLVEALVTLLLFGVIVEDKDPASGGAGDGSSPSQSGGGTAGGSLAEGAPRAEPASDGDTAGAPTTGGQTEPASGGGRASADGHGDDGLDGRATGSRVGGDDGGADEDAMYEELLAAIRGGPAPPRPNRAERRRRVRRGRCRCGGRVVPRAKILVRVDQAALLRGHAEPGELCDIPGIGPVPVSTVRELWPGAVVKLLITRGVDVRNVTSLGRRATEAMASAMQFTMPRCTNIGCDNDRFVQNDHRLGWANVHRPGSTSSIRCAPVAMPSRRRRTGSSWPAWDGGGWCRPGIPTTPAGRRRRCDGPTAAPADG